MARIRTIKPEFWQDEDIALLDPRTQLLAIGLLNQSDDEGFFKAHPQLIKSSIFPFSDNSLNVHGMLTELSNIGYLTLYKGVDGKAYGIVNNFTKHQKVNRPQASKIKTLIEFTEQSVIVHEQITVGKEQGKEQGKERKGARKARKTSLPDNFEITTEMKNFYHSKNYPMDIQQTTENWLNYVRSNDSQYVNWYAAWQNGMAKAYEWYLEKPSKLRVVNGGGDDWGDVK